MLQAIAGWDRRDLDSLPLPVPDFRAGIGSPATGRRIGVLRHFYEEEAQPEVIGMMDTAIRALRGLGCIVEDVQLPEVDDFVACGRIISLAESHNMLGEILRRAPEKLGRWTRDRLAAGAQLSASDYITAQRRRQLLARKVDAAFSRCDAMIAAGARTKAGPLVMDGEDQYWRTRTDVAFNLTGHPVLCLPIELSRDGLPLGIQIVGRFLDEAGIIGLGVALERAVAFALHPGIR